MKYKQMVSGNVPWYKTELRLPVDEAKLRYENHKLKCELCRSGFCEHGHDLFKALGSAEIEYFKACWSMHP